MEFYQSINKYYDHIFPLNPAQVEFVKKKIGENGFMLDIGCGTGSLSIALSNEGYQVNAIDLEQEMIEIAKQKNQGDNPKFDVANMLDINTMYKENQFDGVVCFGNTLAHLLESADVKSFIDSSFQLLKTGGWFMVQILNYDHIMNVKLPTLPLIDNKTIIFNRRYEYLDNGLIAFKTTLTIKQTGENIDNNAILNPITKADLKKVLINVGFKQISFYGNFNGEALLPDSLPMIAIAKK